MVDLSPYQPDSAGFKEQYEALMDRELCHETIAPVIRVLASAIIVAGTALCIVLYS